MTLLVQESFHHGQEAEWVSRPEKGSDEERDYRVPGVRMRGGEEETDGPVAKVE